MRRIFDFSSVHNFRDFGNYATENGGHISPRKLFRSAHLSALNPGELSHISKLGLGLVVDLRYKPERERQKNRLPENPQPHVLEYPDSLTTQTADYAPHEMFIQHDLRKPEDARRYMLSSYSARPNDPGFKKIFADTLKFMAETGDPVLIHCTAGKDRTGTLAAIILGTLGVDHETIMEDFMLTMSAVDVDSFLAPAAEMMGQRFGRAYDPEALRPMFGVEKEYLLAALENMGDIKTYVQNSLGLSSVELKRIEQHYLKQ